VLFFEEFLGPQIEVHNFFRKNDFLFLVCISEIELKKKRILIFVIKHSFLVIKLKKRLESVILNIFYFNNRDHQSIKSIFSATGPGLGSLGSFGMCTLRRVC